MKVSEMVFQSDKHKQAWITQMDVFFEHNLDRNIAGYKTIAVGEQYVFADEKGNRLFSKPLWPATRVHAIFEYEKVCKLLGFTGKAIQEYSSSIHLVDSILAMEVLEFAQDVGRQYWCKNALKYLDIDHLMDNTELYMPAGWRVDPGW